MTMLGSVTLSENIILTGLENAPGIAHSQRRTLLGESVVQTAPTTGGRALVLRSANHLTRADINAVKELEAAGNPVTLVHDRGTFTVIITGIDVEPAFEHADPRDDDWYSGTISLIEV